MDDQRLAGEPRDREPRGVGQPVVGVDHVEVGALGDLETEARVRLRLGDHVAAVVAALGIPGGHRRRLLGWQLRQGAFECGHIGLRLDVLQTAGAKQDLESPLIEEPLLQKPPKQWILGMLTLVVRARLHRKIDEIDVLEDASDAIDGLLHDLDVGLLTGATGGSAIGRLRSVHRPVARIELGKRVAEVARRTHQRDAIRTLHRARGDRLGQDEGHAHAGTVHRLDQTVARRPQPSGDEGGELPAEHENARWHESP